MSYQGTLCAAVILALSTTIGCTSTRSSNTARTGMEQLLVSNAVDQSLDRVDFRPFSGVNVYLDEKYVDCVDKNYVISSVRHRIMRAGGYLAAKPEDATIVVEIRSGGVGTDTAESFVGVPEITLPGMLSLPEVRLLTRSTQTGTAKIGLVAYDAKTKQVLGEGGISLARSDDHNWYVLGIGPYQSGSVRNEVEASSPTWAFPTENSIPHQVAFTPPVGGTDQGEPAATVRLTSEEGPQ